MARVFLDTNKFIDSIYRNTTVRSQLAGHEVYTSPLSVYILCYVQRLKLPSNLLGQLESDFHFTNFSENILISSIQGPTSDLEDNIQLHSAAEAECDTFLTNDEKLLKMTFFGKTRIVSALTL